MKAVTKNKSKRGFKGPRRRFKVLTSLHLRNEPLTSAIIEEATRYDWDIVDMRFFGGDHSIVREFGADGLLICQRPEAALLQLAPAVVVVGYRAWFRAEQAVTVVEPEFERVGRVAVEHFLERGFRHMGCVNIPVGGSHPPHPTVDVGVGFERRLQASGAQCVDALMLGNLQYRSGRQKFAAWLETIPRPVGLLVWQDRAAAMGCAFAVLAVPTQAQELISTAVNGEVIAWSSSHNSYPGTQAMNGNTTTARWLPYLTGLPNIYVTWQFTIARHSVTKYRIYHSSTENRAPLDIEVHGSNDNTNWTLLDAQTDVPWTSNGNVEYVLTEPSDYYEYFKLVVTDVRIGGNTYVAIREFELYGTVEPVTFFRSLEVQSIQNTTATVGTEFGTPNVSSDVTVHYGTTDGGQNASAWDSSAIVGTWDDVALTNFSHQITGLTPNTHYFFTFRATDSAETTWAPDVLSFSTGPNLYEESFDYGETGSAIGDLANWSAATNLKYDPNGLTHAGLAGMKGGSMWLDDTTSRSSTDSTPNRDLGIVDVGETFWFAAIFDYKGGNSNHRVQFTGGAVSTLAIEITSGRTVQIQAAQDRNAGAVHDTGVAGVADGTYLMLLKVTKGSPKNHPDKNTRLDFWFNPADASSESALGNADWTKTDGLWGRDGDTFTSVVATPSQGGRIDEIRVATDLEALTGGIQPPPPAGTVILIN